MRIILKFDINILSRKNTRLLEPISSIVNPRAITSNFSAEFVVGRLTYAVRRKLNKGKNAKAYIDSKFDVNRKYIYFLKSLNLSSGCCKRLDKTNEFQIYFLSF